MLKNRWANYSTMKGRWLLPCSWQFGVSFCHSAKMKSIFLCDMTLVLKYCDVLWLATLFLELWKRHRALHVSKWKVFDWCEEEVRVITFFLIITFSIFNVHLLMEPNNLVYPQEELILEIINNPKCKPKVFSHSYLRSIVVLLLVTLVVRNFHLLLTHTNK